MLCCLPDFVALWLCEDVGFLEDAVLRRTSSNVAWEYRLTKIDPSYPKSYTKPDLQEILNIHPPLSFKPSFFWPFSQYLLMFFHLADYWQWHKLPIFLFVFFKFSHWVTAWIKNPQPKLFGALNNLKSDAFKNPVGSYVTNLEWKVCQR